MTTELCENPQLRASHSAQRATILIVDDDAALADVLSVRLRRQGYDTIVATSGGAGLAMVATDRPDLVVLDLRLPDIDGMNICEQLTDSPNTCHIPVIILSGMERPDIIRRSRAAGCQYFVRKPYDPNALLLLIQHSLQGASDWHVAT